jgi:predicted RNase H-like nuclease
MENEISSLERSLKEKKGRIRKMRCEIKNLVDYYRKVEDDQEKTSREEKCL